MTKLSRSIALLIGLLFPLSIFAQSDNSQKPEVSLPVHADVMTRPLRDIADRVPERAARGGRDFEPGRPSAITNQNPATVNTYGPIGVGGGTTVDPKAGTTGVPIDPNARVAPPDTTGDLGPNHYVQWVNLRYSIYDVVRDATTKAITGFNLNTGPINGNAIFSGFGGQCETSNDGDPLVQYDQAADRWVLTQFAVSTTPYLQCVAVSTSPDPTGTYNRYAYSFGTDMNDFPKMGIWNDNYVITYNMFRRARTFVGGRVCGYERSKMLVGDRTARQICATNGSYASFLPADVDGTIYPTAGSAVPLLSLTSTQILSWKFSVNWTAGTASLTGPSAVSGVTAFSRACGGGTCIPQAGTTNQLDSLGDRLNYRLSYRKFADGHDAMVVNHAIAANGGTGIRWYELTNVTTAAVPTVKQQGTYAPDSSFRWMGSAATDKTGGIAIGYNISSSSMAPGLRYAGRGPADTAGVMGAETTMFTGAGVQTGTLARWGDYSTISVDPVDGCTMVYTSEYIPSNGSFNWSTYIGSFKLSTCQ